MILFQLSQPSYNVRCVWSSRPYLRNPLGRVRTRAFDCVKGAVPLLLYPLHSTRKRVKSAWHSRRLRMCARSSGMEESLNLSILEKQLLFHPADDGTPRSEAAAGDCTYEMKLDGYRALAIKAGSEVRVLSRNRTLFSHNHPGSSIPSRR
jgi:ATP-dependent DNA ligase